MKLSDELKQEISGLKDKIENFQREGKYKDALQLADELNKKYDQLKIEMAKEKATFENFLKGDIYQITPNGEVKKSRPQFRSGVEGEEYAQKFFNAFRRKFQDSTGYLREGAPTQGGYLLPTEFGDQIISKLENENVMRQICTVLQTEANHEVIIQTSPPVAAWTGEGQTINLTTEEFGKITLGAHKLAAAISVTNELLADSVYDLSAHITEEFAKALGMEEEKSFLTGDGVGKPEGLITTLSADSDCYLMTVNTYIDANDLIKLQYSLPRQYRRNACWLTNEVEFAEIRKLKDEYGRFIWEPSLSAGEPPRLLGSPIYASPYIPHQQEGGENSSIVLFYGDFKRAYYIAERGQRTVKALRELNALQDMTSFLMIERIDGKVIDKNAIKGLKIGT